MVNGLKKFELNCLLYVCIAMGISARVVTVFICFCSISIYYSYFISQFGANSLWSIFLQTFQLNNYFVDVI